VAVINPRAEALYKRVGFEVTEIRESNLSNQYGTVPSMHRMEMAI
jgi:ribosomal protein S18 acetylase RimI-like enzyme